MEVARRKRFLWHLMYLGLDSRQQKERACSKISEKQKVSKTTEEMTGFMDDLTLSSPKQRSLSCSRSNCSRRSSSVSSGDSAYSSNSSSSISSGVDQGANQVHMLKGFNVMPRPLALKSANAF